MSGNPFSLEVAEELAERSAQARRLLFCRYSDVGEPSRLGDKALSCVYWVPGHQHRRGRIVLCVPDSRPEKERKFLICETPFEGEPSVEFGKLAVRMYLSRDGGPLTDDEARACLLAEALS